MGEFRIIDENYLFEESVVLTASTEDTAFPVSNLTKFQLAKVWRMTSLTSQSLVIDLQTAEEIDSFAMLFHPVNGVKFTDGATLKLQANATNTWASPAVDVTLSIDFTHEIVTHFFTSAQSYRYWRVTFSDALSTYDHLEVAKIILGKATQLTQNPEIGFTMKQRDRSKKSENDYGSAYTDVYPSQRELTVGFRNLSETDKRTLWGIYNRLGKATPLAVALDPTQAIFTDKDEHFLYGYLENDWAAAQSFYTYFDVAMRVEEAL